MSRNVCFVAGVIIGLSGCSKVASPVQPVQIPTAEQKDHSHGSGPHGGTVTDWGRGAYHVEFTVDHDKKEATVYVLGSDGKSPAPIATEKIVLVISDNPPFQVELLAKPLEGEMEGKSSRFVGQHDGLGTIREFEGIIRGEFEGGAYRGSFKEPTG